ncbi:MAG: prenyltransferase [Candidatus Marsarchaeota archaeon]|nr:prenyltransferase [Candidatus Marsarchaeota archaeon]
MAKKSKGWTDALRGFYSPSNDVKGLGFMPRLLFSARSVILIISLQAAIIASILSYAAGAFNILYSILLAVGLVSVHMASNLMNDYFGYKKGHDTPDAPRRNYTIHPLADGVLSEKGIKSAVAALVLVGFAIALFFTYLRGPVVMLFALAGLALMLLYDASPVTLKSVGLGEIASFFVWGPLMIGGGFYALTGTLSLDPFLISLPYGLGVMSILVGKHIDQMSFDRKKRQNTLPMVLGDRNARIFNLAAISGMYLLVPIFIYLKVASIFTLLVFLNLPRASRAISAFSKPRPAKPPAGYVGWPLWYHRFSLANDRDFGWLYILGLALGAVILL